MFLVDSVARFWWGLFCRGGLSDKRLGAAPCQAQTSPASSKLNPPLAKAHPVSEAGGTSVITCLRKGKTLRRPTLEGFLKDCSAGTPCQNRATV